jgi:hypothetical protein
MSARLNMNETRYYSWKGKTFNQITSAIQKNKLTLASTEGSTLFNARPLAIYRRESATVALTTGNPRISVSIDEINRPNGYNVANGEYDCSFNITNIITNKDMNITTNKSQNGTCTNTNPCMSDGYNARRRVRSGGMIKKNSAATGVNYEPYYTSTKQLLNSRNKSFEQNQYHYIRQGDSSAKPGDNNSANNLYSTNTISKCSKVLIHSDLGNNTFEYQWFDGIYYTVTITNGYYDIDDLNAFLKNTMNSNKHYIQHNTTKTKTFFMNIAYNTTTKKLILQSTAYNTLTYSTSVFDYPTGNSWDSYVSDSTILAKSVVPVFYILDNGFQNVIGFSTGKYPSSVLIVDGGITYQGSVGNYAYDSDQSSSSSSTPTILPTYSIVYYKPNNSQFAQQGAVSSSSLITRLKYNTITNNAYTFQVAFGKAVGNALAYGVPEGGYTIKDKIGYPIKKTPTFSKYSDGFKSCQATKFSNII